MTIQYSRSFLKYIHASSMQLPICGNYVSPRCHKLSNQEPITECRLSLFNWLNNGASWTKFIQDIEIVLGYFSGVDSKSPLLRITQT